MKARIVNTVGMANETTVIVDDGNELQYISGININIEADNKIYADLRFVLPLIDVKAEVTVSEEHLKELAEAHGYDLVKR